MIKKFFLSKKENTTFTNLSSGAQKSMITKAVKEGNKEQLKLIEKYKNCKGIN